MINIQDVWNAIQGETENILNKRYAKSLLSMLITNILKVHLTSFCA